MCVQNNLKPSSNDIGTETDHSELLKHNLTSVTIMEDDEENEDEEEEFKEPEPEPTLDNDEHMLMSITEK